MEGARRGLQDLHSDARQSLQELHSEAASSLEDLQEGTRDIQNEARDTLHECKVVLSHLQLLLLQAPGSNQRGPLLDPEDLSESEEDQSRFQ